MTWQTTYVAAGLVLACYYVPQIATLLRDRTCLAAYSLPKASVQLGARALMLPFVYVTVDSVAMLSIQALDFVMRSLEWIVAVWVLAEQRAARRGEATGDHNDRPLEAPR